MRVKAVSFSELALRSPTARRLTRMLMARLRDGLEQAALDAAGQLGCLPLRQVLRL